MSAEFAGNAPVFTENVTVDPNGNIPFSDKIKSILSSNGMGAGTDVTISFNGRKQIVVMDTALYALQEIQEAMKGKAKEAGFQTEEEFDAYILRSSRR